MKKCSLSLLLILSFSVMSCRNNELVISEQECSELQRNYSEVNEMLRMQIQNYIGEMEEEARQYSEVERMKLFLPLAKEMESQTLTFNDTLEKLKGDYYFNKQKETFTVDKINEKHLARIKQLNHKEYWQLDSAIGKVSLTSKLNDKLFKSFKRTKSKAMYQLLLCKLQQDAYIASNGFIEACYFMEMPRCNLGGTFSNGFFFQNTTHLRKGEILKIQTGINQTVSNAKAFAIIDKQTVKEDSTGLIEYKKRINQKPGKYRIPIQVSYVLPDGKPSSFNSGIAYTVDE